MLSSDVVGSTSTEKYVVTISKCRDVDIGINIIIMNVILYRCWSVNVELSVLELGGSLWVCGFILISDFWLLSQRVTAPSACEFDTVLIPRWWHRCQFWKVHHLIVFIQCQLSRSDMSTSGKSGFKRCNEHVGVVPLGFSYVVPTSDFQCRRCRNGIVKSGRCK